MTDLIVAASPLYEKWAQYEDVTGVFVQSFDLASGNIIETDYRGLQDLKINFDEDNCYTRTDLNFSSYERWIDKLTTR